MIGDPSGKTDMRKMLTVDGITSNMEAIKKQMERFIDFQDYKAILANNADWLTGVKYIEFIRDIGVHFSVNHMLAAECYKQRLERGLTFLEFNYMLLQSYDFLQLFKQYNCRLQMGGDDQWSNILGGVDLIRKKEREDAFACTLKLLLSQDGIKMGKTEKGALWLDASLCSPYDFFQYLRNVDDADVEKCLGLLTFLPMDEVRRLGSLKDQEINEAKKILAFECTQLVHGKEEAQKAQLASVSLFGGGQQSNDVPTYTLTRNDLDLDSRLTTLLASCGLCSSRSDARKMIQQGAILAGDSKVTDIEKQIDASLILPDGLLLRKGKKNYCRLLLK